MTRYEAIFESIRCLAEGLTPEMLSRRAELQADIGMDDYRRRIGGWTQALRDFRKPEETVLAAAMRGSRVMRALGHPEGEAWVLAAYVEIRQECGVGMLR